MAAMLLMEWRVACFSSDWWSPHGCQWYLAVCCGTLGMEWCDRATESSQAPQCPLSKTRFTRGAGWQSLAVLGIADAAMPFVVSRHARLPSALSRTLARGAQDS